MQSPGLFDALRGGMKDVATPSSLAPAPAPAPSAEMPGAGPSLYQTLVAAGPKDPDPKKAKAFVDTLPAPSMQEMIENLWKSLQPSKANAAGPSGASGK